MPRPLVPLASSFALGCAVTGAWHAPYVPRLLALAAVLLGLVWWRPEARRALWALAAASLALGGAARALAEADYERADLYHLAAAGGEAPVRLVGEALADGRAGAERLRLLLAVQEVQLEGRARQARGRLRLDVGGTGPFPEVRAGDTVSAWATLRAPRSFNSPGAFDAAAHARRAGWHAQGYCKSTRLLQASRPARAGLRARAAALRAWVRRRVAEHVPAGPERQLLLALLLGDQQGVDRETDERFRAAGTYHVLALSGAQVALVAGGLVWVVRRSGGGPWMQAWIAGGATAGYAFLVGGEVPVVRAAVMAAALLLGRALELEGEDVNLLALAAVALLAWRPSAVADVGWQLSFAATWAVLDLAPALTRGWRRWPLGIERALGFSLAAQMALAPLLAWHFQRLAPAALLLNLAAVPLAGCALLCGLLAVVAAQGPPWLGTLCGDGAWIAAHALRASADLLELCPWLDVRVPPPTWWAAAACACGALGLRNAGSRGRAGFALGLGVMGLVCGPARRADGRLHLAMLDVGQGEALVLTAPEGGVWVVDAGGPLGPDFDLGEAVVGPYLWSRGVRRLDGILVSHAHPDHAAGVPFLLRTWPVGQLVQGPSPPRDAQQAALSLAARAARVSVRGWVSGCRQRWGGVVLSASGPPPRTRMPWRVENDDSVVLEVRFGGQRWLLAGDAERQGEQRAARPAGVLKVPHHGSRTSSQPDFLARVAPRLALVSAGTANRFGHPHPEVVERFRALGCLLLRTDRDGSLFVATDGERLWVRTSADGSERELPWLAVRRPPAAPNAPPKKP